MSTARAALLAAGVLAVVCAFACGDDDVSPTASPTASPSPSAIGTPSPDLGAPAFDADRALEHVRELAVEIGSRPAGSEAELQAAEYLREELASYGYEASLQPFTFESYVDLGSRVYEISAASREIEALAIGQSVQGTVEAPLVAAGIGRPQEFPQGTSGSITLIERGALFFSEKVANAAAAGAIGVIVYNSEPGNIHGQLTEPSAIPAVTISQEDGQALLASLNGGPVTSGVEVLSETRTAESRNVIARAPGHACTVLAGGHYDSVPAGPGANDNASGTAVVVEMARVLAADSQMDDACFVLFGAEELGLLGSAHYVGTLSDGEKGGIEGMLNFDMLAVGEGWPFVGSRGLVDIAAAAAARLDIAYSVPSDAPEGVGSDHASFIDAGIPGLLFNCFCDDNYHTANDRFEFVQKERLAEGGALGLAVLAALLAR